MVFHKLFSFTVRRSSTDLAYSACLSVTRLKLTPAISGAMYSQGITSNIGSETA